METIIKEKAIKMGELQDYIRELINKGIVSEGTCSTAADTAAKTVTLGTTFKFESKATFLITFSNAITVANATLAVTHTDPEGVTTTETAKPIYYRGAALPANKVSAGDELILRYDGEHYNVISTLAQDFTETDPVFTASPAYDITSEDITNWNGKTSNIGTITGITMNGASKGTSGVVDLGTVLTSHQSKSDIGLGNVDNTSDATKKSNFTGSIASGNTGFVTGDDVYDALAGKADLGANGKVSSSQLPDIPEIGTTTGTAADGGIVNTHVNDTDIHVTLQDKSNWSGKQDALVFNTTYDATTNKVATMADVPTAMSASGTNHKGGLVPDPGATQGTTKFLREDGSWQVPAYPTIEDFHEAVATLSAAPTSSTTTYTRDGVTYEYKIGDQVRVHDTEKGTAEGNYYVFYTLKDKSNNTAYWEESGTGGGVSMKQYSVVIDSNQSDKTDIANAKVTYSGTQYGNGDTISVSLSTTISPSDLTISSVTGYSSSVQVTGLVIMVTYSTEVLSLTVSASNSVDVSSQQVTVTDTSDDSTLGTLVSGQTLKIPFGINYKLSAASLSGFTTPTDVTATASQISRSVSMVYTYRFIEGYIILDQSSSDPAQKVVDMDGHTYSNYTTPSVITAIRNNSHCYVGTFANDVMSLKQLDDADGTMYANGTSAATDIASTSKNVFMRLPYFFTRATEITSASNQTAASGTDIWKIEFSYDQYQTATSTAQPSGSNWKQWGGNDLIGKYKAECSDTGNNTTGVLRSRSGITPTVGVSNTNFKIKARNNGTGFSLIKLRHHNIMGILFAAYYGNTDSQQICGSGGSSRVNTGLKNSFGMIDTNSSNGNTDTIVFWGLEGIWGNYTEWSDNISANKNILTVSEDDASTRTITTVTTTSSGIYPSKFIIGDELDLIATTDSTGGSSSQGYCDRFRTDPSGVIVYPIFAGIMNESSGGAYYVDCWFSDSDINYNVSTRLAFTGEIQITE